MKKLLLTLFIVIACTLPVYAENVYSLIKKGQLNEAKDSLSQRSSALNRNGDDLYYLSMLEESADKSAQLMEASLRASVSASFRQEIYFRLAQYYFIKNDLRLLKKTVDGYLSKWENGKYRSDMFRLRVYFEENKKNFNSAIREIDRYLMEYTKNDNYQYGLIDKARIMYRYKKYVGANKLLRNLSREKSGPGVSQALYALATDAIKNKKTDDAVFFYNIHRDGFPHSVGLDATIDKLSGMSTTGDKDNKAEEYTGTYYSVQVGVFSSKSNANKFSNKKNQLLAGFFYAVTKSKFILMQPLPL